MQYKVDKIENLKKASSDVMMFIYQSLRIPHQDVSSKLNAFDAIDGFVADLRDNLTVVVESEYIDKDFRDSYYAYYSSKLTETHRNCVRISFLEPIDNLNLNDDIPMKVIDNYRGFVVLRPIKKIIGRNVIDPKILKDTTHKLRIMTADIHSSCLGIKTTAIGFPHSSQDGEMMTCAETTVWSIMEYFGHKYPEYCPMQASKIHKLLSQTTFQRQLPSTGLSVQQISIALKEAGFGSKVYYTVANPVPMNEVLASYIESGIPVGVCMENNEIGHAIVCVGHEKVDISDIDQAPTDEVDGVNLHVWNRHISKFIFNDDNQNPYEVADYSNPADKYVKQKLDEWKGAIVSMLVVPLNRKIYLEANDALRLGKEIAVRLLKARANSVIRTFLASGRTYKEFLLFKSGMPSDKRKWYYALDFPKFVWVTEISDIDVCKRGKFNGLLIFDATDPMTGVKNVLWAQYDGAYYIYDKKDLKVKHTENTLLPQELTQFDLNLR